MRKEGSDACKAPVSSLVNAVGCLSPLVGVEQDEASAHCSTNLLTMALTAASSLNALTAGRHSQALPVSERVAPPHGEPSALLPLQVCGRFLWPLEEGRTVKAQAARRATNEL